MYFQMYSLWVFLAQDMDRRITIKNHSFILPASEVLVLNSLIDVILIPLFAKGLYPFMARIGFVMTDLRKMGIGMLCTGGALVVAGVVQIFVSKEPNVSIFWIIPQFFLVSCGEILLSVTAYEFAYTQAPKNMKGLLTACWLSTVALGNALIAIVNIVNISAKATQYFVMSAIMVLNFFLFLVIARGYKYKITEVST